MESFRHMQNEYIMLKNLHHNIHHAIHWLTEHEKRGGEFSIKKNDQLLQNIVSDIINFAELKMSSDIHIEPQENNIRIRLRIDGVLSEHFQLPKFILDQLNCKLKIMANLDIAQNRLPQDGKIIFYMKNGVKSHIRISTCPTVRGEKIVLRLLKDSQNALSLNLLGMQAQQLTLFTHAISEPHGLILITGPTGSGKTSTLYSTLKHLTNNEKNIITIEDPVEVQLHGINQININLKAELTFSSVLKSILRQDPDVIMIGEIRDEETAQIAINAANTGHLVLATLHTNNCIETIGRLRQMNIDQNELASCLKLIVAQRLLRKKCVKCNYHNNEYSCDCVDGYRGRHGIFELLYFNEQLKLLIIKNPYCTEADLSRLSTFSSLHQEALNCIKSGITTEKEVKRVLNIC